METKKIPLSKLHLNTGQIKDVPKNPRFIKDERYEALKKSIKDDPEMLQLRELVAYDNNGELVVILGNMRYRAMKELGYKDAPVKVLPAETDDLCGFCAALPFPHPKIKNVYRGHRTVVLPDFQGVGIGLKFSNWVAEYFIKHGKTLSVGTRAFSLPTH